MTRWAAVLFISMFVDIAHASPCDYWFNPAGISSPGTQSSVPISSDIAGFRGSSQTLKESITTLSIKEKSPTMASACGDYVNLGVWGVYPFNKQYLVDTDYWENNILFGTWREYQFITNTEKKTEEQRRAVCLAQANACLKSNEDQFQFNGNICIAAGGVISSKNPIVGIGAGAACYAAEQRIRDNQNTACFNKYAECVANP